MIYTQFIDGTLTPGSNRESWTNYNPADNTPLGEAYHANDQDIEAAVQSSEKAFQDLAFQNRCRTRQGAVKNGAYPKIKAGTNCFD